MFLPLSTHISPMLNGVNVTKIFVHGMMIESLIHVVLCLRKVRMRGKHHQ